MKSGGKIALGALAVVGLGTLTLYLLSRTGVKGRPPPCDGYGDVDMDGRVTEADIDLISKYILGTVTFTAEQVRRADVNGDGAVDIFDQTAIKSYLEGVVDTFPVCGV